MSAVVVFSDDPIRRMNVRFIWRSAAHPNTLRRAGRADMPASFFHTQVHAIWSVPFVGDDLQMEDAIPLMEQDTPVAEQ